MCECRQKKSFLIADILSDSGKNTKNVTKNTPHEQSSRVSDNYIKPITKYDEMELELTKIKVNLEQRRNTYPLYPTPIKANIPWPGYRMKTGYPVDSRCPMGLYSEQIIKSDQILRSQLAVNRFASNPYSLRQAYGYDRVPHSFCSPWWGVGGRRKGGQVRFSAAQTGALERRFGASKYLSPDERRALAVSLRLSDRQVKTWFQNRRAKWRRTTPESADPGSPPSNDDSDDDVQIADVDQH
ncbi:hematopoietically-expressed homeobox protein hhex-like [Melitaea cinxia]|uniref:hematopoietically-expressed homeobox protein hhex-like n=1 Tax=Melitaea cinxia TaxID=113334 RepID=UPI001E27314B|nr:hematopoietically-expressed homeobox protein hhex-like [Melitaea cinxia]